MRRGGIRTEAQTAMDLAISFTNLGPYHLARLRALADRLAQQGDRLIAYETAGVEQKYPWLAARGPEPFAWTTLVPGTPLEDLSPARAERAMLQALERDQPDAVAVAGYVRPEALAAAAWARRRGLPAILMSESQAVDRPRVWWKEAIKRRRVRRFDAALVGGPTHRAYLETLGMPGARIALGYNAVDHSHFADGARAARREPEARRGLPEAPYFLTVSRFVPEKNLVRLVQAFALYRRTVDPASAWDLVLCGGGPGAHEVDEAIRESGLEAAIHRPGFVQADGLPRWYAHASAFILPSLSEPWGLVANEAAASGVPLLISERAGCASTLVPEPPGTTGWRLDPTSTEAIAGSLARMAGSPEEARLAMGRQAATIAAGWGPARFADGLLLALEIAHPVARRRRAGVVA